MFGIGSVNVHQDINVGRWDLIDYKFIVDLKKRRIFNVLLEKLVTLFDSISKFSYLTEDHTSRQLKYSMPLPYTYKYESVVAVSPLFWFYTSMAFYNIYRHVQCFAPCKGD